MTVSIYAIAAVLCLQTLCNCVLSTIGQYIYAFYLQTYPFSSNSTHNRTKMSNHLFVVGLNPINQDSGQCLNTNISNASDAWAQEKSADLFSKIGLWSSGPIIVMTLILGLYTPKLGRRFVLILPMVGIFIQISIWLSIIYFQLREYWWYVAAVVVGLSGSDGVLTFVLNLFITDSTIETQRSFRFVLLEGMTTAVTAIGNFGIGYYIAWRGFTDLFWTSLVLQSISILVVIVYFKSTPRHLLFDETTSSLLSPSIDTPNDVQIKDPSSLVTGCRRCFDICNIFRHNGRSKKKSISLLLTLVAYIFYSLAYSAAWGPYLWYLLDAPFCWSSKEIGDYSALSYIFYAVFSVLGMKLLTRAGANDPIICTLSHVFFFASSLWIAFARYSWQLYAGLLITPYGDYQSSLTWSMISKWLEPHERSNAFIFVTEINTISTILGNSFFNWTYAQTVVNHRNFTILLSAGLCTIPFILNICLFMVNRKMSDEDLVPILETDTPAIPSTDVSPDGSDLVIPSTTVVSQSSSSSSVNDETILNNDLMIL